MNNASSDIIIRGVTASGKKFRPSDWAERLAGVLTTFGHDRRTSYSPYVHPTTIEGVTCVVVSPQLREVEPMAYNFLLGFADDNELEVLQAQGKAANS
ncbi:MAG TPA: hypothetical protein DEP05_09495 [Betaproteobacteria bacterium]|nr:hypothetical protein [Betaproteobacteria bacterium]